MSEPRETVTYCPHCHCKTWHVEGVCEWAGSHKVAVPQEATPAMLRAAWDEGGLPIDNGVTAAEELAAKIWRAMVAEVAKQ